MATVALIHGGGDAGWYWHLVEKALRAREHETVAPDLPCDDGRCARAGHGHDPCPAEKPADWWINTGHGDAVREQAERDGGVTGNDDPFVAFYHDVRRALAEEAMSKG